MSRWSAKLEVVDAEGLRQSARVGDTHPDGVSAGDAAAHSVPWSPEQPTDAREPKTREREQPRHADLDELQKRLAKMLGRVVGAEQQPHEPAGADRSLEPAQTRHWQEMGFAPEATEFGPVQVRRRYHRASRVGKTTVTGCSAPSMQMIALLALDPALEAIDPSSVLYFDLETTGLSMGAGTIPFLVGLGLFVDGGTTFVVEQLLLRDLDEERAMISRVVEQMRRASLLVSYNGKAFDVPLLRTRCVMNRLPMPEVAAHLDLVHVARRVHGHRLASVRLATIESEVLGFERKGDIPSAEIPARYFHFLRTGDMEGLQSVVDHNAADVLSMAALMGIYGEPLPALEATDLVGVARTLRRARSYELAQQTIDRAVAGGAGLSAIRTRAEIARARGDKIRALADFESLLGSVDDPKIRLALAKLYEHHAKDPLSALQMLERGTGERQEDQDRRRERLLRKARSFAGVGRGDKP